MAAPSRNLAVTAPRRRPGRPRKPKEEVEKRKPGRPRKHEEPTTNLSTQVPVSLKRDFKRWVNGKDTGGLDYAGVLRSLVRWLLFAPVSEMFGTFNGEEEFLAALKKMSRRHNRSRMLKKGS